MSIKLRDITPKRIYMFIRSKVRLLISPILRFFGYIPEPDLLDFAEMMVFRANTCPDCTRNGACLHCGCAIPGLFAATESSCSNGMWDSLGTKDWKKNWRKFKKQYGIKFQIIYS